MFHFVDDEFSQTTALLQYLHSVVVTLGLRCGRIGS